MSKDIKNFRAVRSGTGESLIFSSSFPSLRQTTNPDLNFSNISLSFHFFLTTILESNTNDLRSRGATIQHLVSRSASISDVIRWCHFLGLPHLLLVMPLASSHRK